MTGLLRAPILLVGGGPCGLMLSIELARRGVRSLLVDAKAATAVNPQANATQARTMEHYRRLGFADEVRALGLPSDHPTDIAYFTRYSGWELARLALPSAEQTRDVLRSQTDKWAAAELPHRVSQKYVEEILRRYAEDLSETDIRYGVRLTDIEEAEDSVIATIEDVATGEVRQVEADYLIGVDGARSFVRNWLGIRYSGETGVERDFFGGKMVAVYFRSSDFYDAMPHPRAWMYWAFNPERRSWCAAVNGQDEFAFHTQLKKDESEDVTPERAKELVRQAMGCDLDIELLSVDRWVAGHALVAESFGRGRIFIGGDAAHLFTPAGGLGYNTAVEDAVNLGWKLAAQIKGVAGPALLPSYAIERRHLALRNTGYARALAESIGNFVPDPQIEADGPEGEAARQAASEYLLGHARREFEIPGITLGGRYDGSPVIKADGAALPPDTMNLYVPTASPGGRVPHMWLADGTSVFDKFGFEWTLIVTQAADLTEAARFAGAAEEIGVELTIVDLTDVATHPYGTGAVLVRPDQIVGWRGATGGVDAKALLGELLGHVALDPAPEANSASTEPRHGEAITGAPIAVSEQDHA